MTLIPDSEQRETSGLTDTERMAIKAFLQGAAYCWVKNRSGEPFAARDLVGGENNDWADTPLQILYDRHIANGKAPDMAFEAAAIDVGWLLKAVLNADRRTFSVEKAGWGNSYRWIGGE